MRVLIKYIDFHWDNYQGGSGKSFEMKHSVDVAEETKSKDVYDFILCELDEHIGNERPFKQTNSYHIKSIEIIS
jgi:hypothetical protein